MTDDWTMIVTHPDGTKQTFKGKRTLKEILEGARDYLLKLRKDGRPR